MKSRIVHGAMPVYRSSVPQAQTKAVRYPTRVSEHSMLARGMTGTLGTPSSNAPMRDPPSNGAQHPDLRVMTKADEAASADRTIGDQPRGTLSR